MERIQLPATRARHFTALPRQLFDNLLAADLSKRELLILLLIARLTFGVRSKSWVPLRQADLAAVGIRASHARECLTRLLLRGLLEHDGNQGFRINLHAEAWNTEPASGRRKRVRTLVGTQLASGSLPKMGSRALPSGERNSS
jgi:hypothetical protein